MGKLHMGALLKGNSHSNKDAYAHGAYGVLTTIIPKHVETIYAEPSYITDDRKVIALVGPHGCGKVSVIEEMQKLGVRLIPIYTTEADRCTDKIKYISPDELSRLESIKGIAEKTVVNHEDTEFVCVTAIEDYIKGGVVILTPQSLRHLKENGIPVYAVLVSASHEEIAARLKVRDPELIENVSPNEMSEFDNVIKYIDAVVDTTRRSPEELAKELVKFHNSNHVGKNLTE